MNHRQFSEDTEELENRNPIKDGLPETLPE